MRKNIMGGSDYDDEENFDWAISCGDLIINKKYQMIEIGNNIFVNIKREEDGEIYISIQEFCKEGYYWKPKYTGISLTTGEWYSLMEPNVDYIIQNLIVSCERNKKSEQTIDVIDPIVESISTYIQTISIKQNPLVENIIKIEDKKFVDVSIYNGKIRIVISKLARPTIGTRRGILLKPSQWKKFKKKELYIDNIIIYILCSADSD